MGDRNKALIIVSTIILALAFSFFYYGVSQHNRTIDLLISSTEADIDLSIQEVRKRSLHDYEKRLQTFLHMQPEIIEAFAHRDRERLYKLCRPKLDTLQKENSYFSNIHFHLPDGHSFLRIHAPETWGEDLITTRPSLKKIHKEKKPVSGFEIGNHGGFFRVIAPVFYQEHYVGAVEFGLDMHQAVDMVHGVLLMPVTSCFREEQWKKATAFNKFPLVRRDGYVINSHGDPIYSKLPLDLPMGAEFHTQVQIEGKQYIIHTHQVFNDFEGSSVGGLIILQDITDFVQEKRSFLRRTAAFTVFLLFLGFTALHLSFNRILNAMSLEIAKRKQAALEWGTAMDADHDTIYLLDLDRHLLRANKAFYEVMKTTPESAVGMPIEEIVHPLGNVDFCPIGEAQKALRNAHIIREPEHQDNDSGLPLEFTVTIVRDSEQNPLSIFMRRHDLTEQRAVEDTLRKSKEEWERTFNSIADLITIQDADMRIVRANRAAEEFFEVASGELVGHFCYQVFRGEGTPCQDCPLLTVSMKQEEHPPIIRHENLKKIFHITSSPLLGVDGKMEYLVHIARDITAQKQLEEELYQAHKMEAIGTLAGGIAHDFNNILAAIIGYSEFVENDLPAESPSRKDIAQVLQSAERARDLVQQILSFSRKSEHHLQVVEPYDIVQEVVTMLHATLPSTVIIKANLDKKSDRIFADPTQIHQILVNLCTNGFQSMEGEKGVLSVSLQNHEVRAGDSMKNALIPGRYVVFQVSDTGAGMDKETQERMLEPFFTTKEVGKGTGMGLAVIHGIVEEYHGVIEVESRIGAGSIFRVSLPAMEDADAAPPAVQKTPEQKTVTGNEKILVVDDDLLLVRINGRILSDLGYQVTEETSSRKALEKVRQDPEFYDLLITDQTMPHLTGAELTTEVIKVNPNIAVIMCTGHSSVVSAKDALMLGISRYLYKPVENMELVHAVREVLEEQENKKEYAGFPNR